MLAACLHAEIDRAALVVKTVDNLPSFESLRNEWVSLLESSPSDGIFLTWGWLFTWWKHLAEGRRLSILTIRKGDELIALAPLCIAPPERRRARFFSSIQFLGAGFSGSDYLDLIARRGYEETAEEILAEHLSRLDRSIEWTQVRCGNSCAGHIADRLQGRGWRVRKAETAVCPFISLAGYTWDSYLASLGSEHRYNFRRKWRRLNQEHSVRLERATTREECREAIEIVMTLHNSRRRERGGSNAFHTSNLVEFHREWSGLALERGWLRLYVLRVDGAPAAALYGFLYGATFYFYQAGFDPAFSRYSVGLLMMGLSIQQAIGEGADEYDLLHGNEEYKSHWSREERKLERLEIDPLGMRGWLSQSMVELGRRANRMIKRFA